MNIAKLNEGDVIGTLQKTLYEIMLDPELKVEPTDNGGIRFEGQWESVVVEDDTLYCEHKSAHQESQDSPGPTPDHPDSTRYFTWCDGCETELEPDDPED